MQQSHAHVNLGIVHCDATQLAANCKPPPPPPPLHMPDLGVCRGELFPQHLMSPSFLPPPCCAVQETCLVETYTPAYQVATATLLSGGWKHVGGKGSLAFTLQTQPCPVIPPPSQSLISSKTQRIGLRLNPLRKGGGGVSFWEASVWQLSLLGK